MGRPINLNPQANLSDRISACPNPEFAQWIRELWQEASQREGQRLQYVYKRAMDSMIMHAEPIRNPKDAGRVPNIGPGIVAKLEKRFTDFLAEGGKMIRFADSIEVPASQPAASLGRVDIDLIGSASQPAAPKTTKPAKKKAVRPYVPTFRSGPYAMLIALYLEGQQRESKGYCTRQEIVSLGQPYCSVPMEEGTFSALKGAIKNLEDKGFVTKWGMPCRYQLTDEGLEMAMKLWNSGERRSSAPGPHESTVNEVMTRQPVVVEVMDENIECVNEADDIELQTFTWPPGTFDLMLLIDNREVKSRTSRDYIFNQLASSGISIEQRSLELGDFIWIAKKKAQHRTGSPDDSEEVVLDLLIERKTEDDLLHSITDGRFVEQKQRINSSGIVNRIYLLERYEGLDTAAFGEAKFKAAINHTQLVDNLFLRYTQNLEESIKFIISLHQDLQKQFNTSPVHVAFIKNNTSVRRASLLTAMHRQSQVDHHRYLMTYECYSTINSKNGNLSLSELFQKQLLAIRSMSVEKASQIVHRFPTPMTLYQMYASLPDDQSRKDYFKDWQPDGHSKKFGPVLSLKIYETFWSS